MEKEKNVYQPKLSGKTTPYVESNAVQSNEVAEGTETALYGENNAVQSSEAAEAADTTPHVESNAVQSNEVAEAAEHSGKTTLCDENNAEQSSEAAEAADTTPHVESNTKQSNEVAEAAEDIGYDEDAAFLQPSTDEAKKLRLKKAGRMTTKAVAYTAVMTALVYVGTIIGYSSQAFYFNLGDAVILICAALFNPVCAMLAGGLGAFFGDMTVYPATMVFTLIIKAVEGLIAGVLFMLINKWYDRQYFVLEDKKGRKKTYALKIVFSCLASLLSVTVMMLGYFMCQCLFYGTVTSALVALPFDCAQGVISLAVANLALYALRLDNFRHSLRLK